MTAVAAVRSGSRQPGGQAATYPFYIAKLAESQPASLPGFDYHTDPLPANFGRVKPVTLAQKRFLRIQGKIHS